MMGSFQSRARQEQDNGKAVSTIWNLSVRFRNLTLVLRATSELHLHTNLSKDCHMEEDGVNVEGMKPLI